MHSYLSPAPVGADTGAARPACPRPWSCTFSLRREPRRPHVCSPRQFRSGGGASRLLSNICPSASAGARRHPAGRLRMLGTGVVKF
ncbi:hypothetical protein PA103_3367 [Pseudomonas aeruginosa PA103]|nr:hypothetical protein CSC41_1915 [Pseudomonas aeruginosa]EYU05611.1 hypothetical protein PA103_3367 [Pseudomonas aeruginosa PA103]